MGWSITPSTGQPSTTSAISVPKMARPARKPLVPSMGPAPSCGPMCPACCQILADDRVIGRGFLQDGAHGLLGGAIGQGDGAGVLLALAGEARAEMGADGGARRIGKALGKGKVGVEVQLHACACAPGAGAGQAALCAAGQALTRTSG
jgi:hypothetical protein